MGIEVGTGGEIMVVAASKVVAAAVEQQLAVLGMQQMPRMGLEYTTMALEGFGLFLESTSGILYIEPNRMACELTGCGVL